MSQPKAGAPPERPRRRELLVSEVRIAIILGSTRPGRRGEPVARWVLEQTAARGDARYELVDLADFALPHLDEPMPPSMGRYEFEHTKRWSDTIDDFDGFVFVTPEYNRAPSGVLKNALDYLYAEWNDKAAGIVSYGAAASGLRAAEALRLILGELQIADVRQSVGFSLVHDFENFQTFAPGPQHAQHLAAQLDQLVAWSRALREVRATKAALAAA
jgi:NAD(P)H-dependent FMN reductase